MQITTKTVTIIKNNHVKTSPIFIIKEEPLAIRLNGKTISIIMRTPGNEKEHVAGFCYTEGLINNIKEISSISLCDINYTNTVTIVLTKKNQRKISKFLNNRQLISQTSCGMCGKTIISEIFSKISPIQSNYKINITNAIQSLLRLNKYQPLRTQTHASHCASIYNKDLKIISSSEDVGRHNALDKTIGKLLLDNTLADAKIVALSSRISYELVQKAAMARIPILLALSRPTSLAINIASKLKITIATLSPNNNLIIYCNKQRLINL